MIPITSLSPEFTSVIAILVGILGVARLTRVIVFDTFPPAVWWRIRWDRMVPKEKGGWFELWNKLFHCWWCLSMWVALACIAWWVWLTPLHVAWALAWWVFWGALALGYIATMVIVRDDPNSDDED